METISLNLHIPADLYKNLITFVPNIKIKSNDFILDAIRLKLKNEKRQLQKSLIEGYKAIKNEDLQIINDFETADFENL